MDDRLYRSRDDRMIAGVAGGVAEQLDADPSLIRIVWAVLIVLTGGLALLVYIVMAVVVPERPPGQEPGRRTPSSSAGACARARRIVARPGRIDRPARCRARRGAGRTGDDATRGGLIAGLVLIVIGGFFLLRQFLPAFDLGLWWPIVAIGLGVVLVVLAVSPSRRSD